MPRHLDTLPDAQRHGKPVKDIHARVAILEEVGLVQSRSGDHALKPEVVRLAPLTRAIQEFADGDERRKGTAIDDGSGRLRCRDFKAGPEARYDREASGTPSKDRTSASSRIPDVIHRVFGQPSTRAMPASAN